MKQNVAPRKAVVVGRAGGRDLICHLHLPPAATEPCPAIVVVHGGGWRKGKPESVRGFGELLGQAGFVCLLADHRPSSEAHWPAQIQDVKCAIRFLRARADALGVDPNRIGILGDSSGGHLALMAGVSAPLEGEFEGEGGYAEHPSTVAAVGSLYGPTRIRFDNPRPNYVALMGADATEADYENASPIAYDLRGFPPCLLIHGAEDEPVPVAHSVEFHDELKRLGRPVDLHLFSGEGHAFDRKTTDRTGRMVDVADPKSVYGRTVLGIIALFFRKYLVNAGESGAVVTSSNQDRRIGG